MKDFALKSDNDDFDVPTILLVGTSMSAGKTMTGKLTCKILSEMGLKVVGAKLTGAGRYGGDARAHARDAGGQPIHGALGTPCTVQ